MKAIFEIEGAQMRICVAGQPIGAGGDLARPDELKRDDDANWVVQTYSRLDGPPPNGIFGRLFRRGWKLRKGRAIPESLLGK